MRKAGAWVFLIVLALIIMVAGATGRLGSALGALITPAQLQGTQTQKSS